MSTIKCKDDVMTLLVRLEPVYNLYIELAENDIDTRKSILKKLISLFW